MLQSRDILQAGLGLPSHTGTTQPVSSARTTQEAPDTTASSSEPPDRCLRGEAGGGSRSLDLGQGLGQIPLGVGPTAHLPPNPAPALSPSPSLPQISTTPSFSYQKPPKPAIEIPGLRKPRPHPAHLSAPCWFPVPASCQPCPKWAMRDPTKPSPLSPGSPHLQAGSPRSAPSALQMPVGGGGGARGSAIKIRESGGRHHQEIKGWPGVRPAGK